jgi:PAS domain S-box-containing protein
MPIEAPLLVALFERAAVGIYATDADGRVTGCNPHSERLLGYRESEVLGRDVHELVHRARDGSVIPVEECPLREVMVAGRAADGTGFFSSADGTLLTVRWTSAPILLAGAVTGSVVVFTDETSSAVESEQRATEHTALTAAHERLTMLADATTALTETLDLPEALRRLARITVPRLGDWSVVDLVTDDGQVERVTVVHRDPDRPVPAGGPVGALAAVAEAGRSPLARVLAGSDPVLLTHIEPPGEAAGPIHRAQLELFDELGARSAVVAPLRARGRVLGALTVARSDPGEGAYGPAETALLADLAGRAGLAVDNARLYGAQRATAEALQGNLLPDLPSTRHLSLAARYRPARKTAEVGGDWYDAFRLLDGALALVIGDVVGHGVAAAARMGELRNLLRGIAVTTGAPPSSVMTRFDEAVTHLTGTSLNARDPDRADLATGIYARVEGRPGAARRLVWCNAGHPPPLLVDPDGTVRYLDQPTGMLVGLGDRDRVDGEVDLPAGVTLLFYTDGLVESRDQPIGEGVELLRHHASELAVSHADLPLDDLCDGLLERLSPSGTDDVALLAARVEPT